MENPTDLYRVGGAEGNEGVKLARLDPNFPAVAPPNQYPRSDVMSFRAAKKPHHCGACGAPYHALRSWHALCGQCFHGATLYLAIARYREALK